MLGSYPRTRTYMLLHFQNDWRDSQRQNTVQKCEVTQTELKFPKTQGRDLCTFHICSGISSCQESTHERKLMPGRTTALGPQGPTSVLPGWMAFLICCIATSPVSCLFFLSTSSVKCLQWDVIRLRKGGQKHHFICYLLPYLCLQS